MDQLEALRDLIESGLSEEDYRININDWINHEFWKDLKDEEIKEKQSIH